MAKQILGKVVPIVKGTYNSSTQYSIQDIVEYNGSSYIAKQNVQGQAPTNTTYWQLLASQGDKPVYKVDYLTDAEMDGIVADIISDSTNAFNQNVTAKTTAFNNNATDKTSAFNSNATSKTSDFNTNASSKTTAFNSNASDKQSDFNSNASSTKDDFDRNATAKTEAYDDNASSKLSAYNDNATSKVNAYNSNASDKTTAFNNNATSKTTAYNNNAQAKIDEYDNHIVDFQAELDEATEELNRYKTIENALPHVNGTGESITLNDTANSPLGLELKGNIYQETTSQSDNLLDSKFLRELSGTTINGITMTLTNNGTILLNGTSMAGLNFTQNFLKPLNDPDEIYNIRIYKLGGSVVGSVYFTIADQNGGNAKTPQINANSSVGVNGLTNNITYTKGSIVIAGSGVVCTDLEIGIGYFLKTYSESVSNWEKFIPNSPTPDYPQDIHTISGDNTIKVENKNWFDEVWEIGGVNGTDGTNENNEDTTRIRTKNYIPVKPSIQYTLSFDASNTNSDGARLVLYDKNKAFINTLWYNSTSGNNWTFETTNDTKYIRFTAKKENGNWDLSNIKFQLELGTATTYVSHQEQTAQLKLPVENLFNKDNANILNGYINQATSKIVESSSGVKTIYIQCKPNTTYTIQKALQPTVSSNRFNIADSIDIPSTGGDISNVITNPDGTTKTLLTITTSNNANYLLVTVYYPDDEMTLSELLSSLQIEKGSKANSYTSYGTTPIEYCKIGDYKDRFFKNIPEDADYDATRELGKWYLKKNIGKVVFNGTENWENWTVNNDTTQTLLTIKLQNINNLINISNVYATAVLSSSHFSYLSQASLYDSYDEKIATTGGNLYFKILKTTVSTLADFKTWLSTHDVIVYYELATPTYTLLNNTLQSQLETIYNKLLGYQEQTNISQVNNDLAFNIKAKAVYDLNKLVERVTTLENE